MREAPSRTIIDALLRRRAVVVAYDPVAMEEARRVFGPLAGLSYASSPLTACDGADALIVVTEWKEFRGADFDVIKALLKSPLIFDGRNLYDPAQVKAAGFEYSAIGRR